MGISVISFFKSYLPLRGSFGRNVLTLMSGTLLGQVLTIAATPVITRLYTPSDLGIFEVYGSILAIIVVVASLRYQIAIPLPQDDKYAADIVVLCLLIVISMTIFTILLVWLFGQQTLHLIKAQYVGPYIWLLPLGVLGAGSYQVLNFWAIRKQNFSLIAWTKITQSFGRSLAQISLGLLGFGPAGLLIGDVVGQCSGSTRLALSAWRQDKESLRRTNFAGINRGIRRYKRFPLLSGAAALLNSTGVKLPSILIAIFYGLKVAGWFALAQWVIVAPMTLLGTSLAQVYMAESAKLAKQSPEGLPKLFWKTLKIQFIVAAPIILVLAIPAQMLFSIVFGEDWKPAGLYVQVLSIMLILRLVSNPLGSTVDILERQGLFLVRELLRTILMCGAVLLAAKLGMDAIAAIFLLSVAGCIAYSFGIFLSWYAIMHYKGAK